MIDKVLFVMEKFCDADPMCGPSGAEHQIVGAVMSTGLVGESKHFYFDTLSRAVGRKEMERLLLQTCAIYRPELIIYTPLGGALGQELNPSHVIMEELKRITKVFLNLWDAPESGLEQQWLPSATFLGIDSLLQNYRKYKHLPNVLFQHSTVDPAIHYDKELTRDIDVSFVGSVDPTGQRWPLRSEYIGFLQSKGVNVVVAGGQRGIGRLLIEECGNILNRSKISLDFCLSTNRKPTMHLRTFEVMACGALLLSDWNTLAGELFEPGNDFIVFHSKEELLELVQYYLAHHVERHGIAARGCSRVANIFNARNMWGNILQKMGFELPESLTSDQNYILHKTLMENL